MRNDPKSEGLRWLTQAQKDLYWAGHLAEQGGYHLACFLSQQVAEKALKGFIYAQGEEIVLGHSVERLCRDAGKQAPIFLRESQDMELSGWVLHSNPISQWITRWNPSRRLYNGCRKPSS